MESVKPNLSVKRDKLHWGVFFVVFVAYLASPVVTSYDSHWSIHTGLSILHQGNTDIDEYLSSEKDRTHFALEQVNGHYYSLFPVGTSVLSLPFIAIADVAFDPIIERLPALERFFVQQLADHDIYVDQLKMIDVYPAVELVIASFYTALAGVFIFLIARLQLNIPWALFVVFIFAFCTSSWSTSSRGLWQHGPSVMFLSLALYLLLREKIKPGFIHYMAIPLALAFIIRPTNAIPVFFFSLYVLLYYRPYFIKFMAIALPFALVYFAYNFSVYQQFFPTYSQVERVLHGQSFFTALAGHLISPARGLFIYSPILLLAFYGLLGQKSVLSRIILSLMLLHWLLIASFPHWWGGHCYGSRLMTDMLPYFIYFIVLALHKISLKPSAHQHVFLLVIFPFVLFSFYVHYQGAFNHAVFDWNSIPNDIDQNPQRLWDWQDIAIFRKTP